MGSAAQVLDSNADSGIGRGNTPDRQDSFDQRGGEVSPSLALPSVAAADDLHLVDHSLILANQNRARFDEDR